MQRQSSAAAVWLCVCTHVAAAGTVQFDPPHVEVQAGEVAEFDVWIGSSVLAEFDSVSILVGSNDGLPLPPKDFVLGPQMCQPLAFCNTPPASFAVYASDLNFGGSDFAWPHFAAPLLVGTVFVETSGFAPGAYEIMVSAEEELRRVGILLSLISSGGKVEPLEGRATITVIAEPLSLVILAAGLVVAPLFRIRKGMVP
jgi:hypothetical protein